MGCNSCNSTPCCCRVFRGPKGPAGNRGPTGPTGPTGPAGTFTTAEATGNPAQLFSGAVAQTNITGATLPVVAGTYLAIFESDYVNGADTSDGDYGFAIDGVPVATVREYKVGVGGFFRDGGRKMVINERLVVASPGTLTVYVVQTAGAITVGRFSLITMKTA